MKILTRIAFALSILCSCQLLAKNIGMDISYAQFMTEEGQGYVEVYFALSSETIDFKKASDNTFNGGVEITVQVKDGEEIVGADKFLVQSPNLKDTTDVKGVYINQTRFTLPKGVYNLIIDLKDINEPSETYHLEQDIELEVGGQKMQTSDLVVLDSYNPSSGKNIFSKSGYDLVPMVNSGSYYFTESVEEISFYVELYNIDKALGKDDPYLLKYYIQNSDNNEAIDKYASFSKKSATTVQPLLAQFKISDLPTGNYAIVVEALDSEGKKLISKELGFYRKNSIAPITISDIETADYRGTFADRINSLDSLYQYTKYLFPISSDAERRYQKELLAGKDISKLKRYFFVFWSQRNKFNPELAWEEYHENVKTVNQLYSSRLRKGYMTDRGRVFLTYGKPDAIDRRQFEPDVPPYEMWQYNVVASPYVVNQTNRFFVFAEFDRSTNDYQLVHSTAVGELNNRRWKYQLQENRFGTGGNVDETEIGRSRVNDQLIIQGNNNRNNR